MLENRDKLFDQDLSQFISAIKNGKERETARAITLLENKDPWGKKIIKKLYQDYNKPYIIGITGPAGSGKSSLLNLVLKKWLKTEKAKIAVIAVDPSSQQSGGAFLGDRIRMKDLVKDKNVFIRSMASRGNLGGVNTAVYDTAVILAAAGYQKIVIETVGVGQTEIDIVSISDTTLVVTVPEAGDEMQIFKSELMELGDIFVLNKSDLPNSDKMEVLIRSLFYLDKEKNINSGIEGDPIRLWQSSLLKTSVLKNQGIEALIEEIEAHYNYLKDNKMLERNKRIQLEKHLFNLLRTEITAKIMFKFNQEENIDGYLAKILSGSSSPIELIEEFIDNKLTC